MEDPSWSGNHGRAIMKEKSRRRNHGGGIVEEKSCRRGPQDVPRDPQEAARKPPGGPQRHPEDAQRHPGDSQRTRSVFDEKCAKTMMFYSKNEASEPFRLDGSDVTLTKSHACAQK